MSETNRYYSASDVWQICNNYYTACTTTHALCMLSEKNVYYNTVIILTNYLWFQSDAYVIKASLSSIM